MDHRFEYSYMYSIAQYCVTWCKMHLIVQCLRQYLIAQYLRGGDEAMLEAILDCTILEEEGDKEVEADCVMGSHADRRLHRTCVFIRVYL